MTVGAKPGTSGVPILHDPFSLGTAGQVRSHAGKRTGAVVYQGRAFANGWACAGSAALAAAGRLEI